MNSFKNSTIVRKEALPIFWEGLAAKLPQVAEPLLTQLFLTSRWKMAKSRYDGVVLGHVELRSKQVAVRSIGEGPIVLLVHGWQGNMGQFNVLRESLVARGYRVVSFDMPAHGESKGRTSNIIEFSEVLLEVAIMVGPVHAVVAHSLGGTALSVALRRGLEVQGAVMIAPMISFDFALNEFAKVLGLGERARELAAQAAERKVGVSRKELDLARFEQPHSRLLLIHDRDDRRAPAQDSARLSQLWDVPMIETSGLGHSRLLQAQVVVDDIGRFIDKLPRPDSFQLENHLGALPQFRL